MGQMTPLPIDRYLPDIVAAVKKSRSVVVVAQPGAGKTTRVPPAILKAELLGREHPDLVLLQPRRVAARAAAMRIAEENGWEVGREVGYHVRFDRHIGPKTHLRVLTEGILARQLVADPFVENVGAVVLDEFHERSLHTDLAMAMLREVQQTVRDDLLLIVMSATLEAGPVAKFLGNCPIIRVEGRVFPIEIHHLDSSGSALPERIVAAVEQVLHGAEDAGDILVFLPGVEEIRRCMERLEGAAQHDDLIVLPLHGSLPAEDQILALRPSLRRKIILATNIAETSLTIDGVRTVIDSGLARVAGYDPQRGLDRLELKRISKASSMQRAGRAGRTAPGRCLRLWTAKEHHTLAEYELPEVQRVDLCSTVLAIHAWGQGEARKFGWYEMPPDQTLASAERLLAMLGALTDEANGKITALGRKLMALPIHPRLGRLLVAAAEHGMLHQGAALAALLSEKDICLPSSEHPRDRRPTLKGPSDLLVRLDLLERAEKAKFGRTLRDQGIDTMAARQVARVRDELVRIGRRLVSGHAAADRPPNEQVLLRLLLLAYPDRVARRRQGDPNAALAVGGGGLRLAAETVVHDAEFFVALDARQDQRSIKSEALVRIASAIEMPWLEELFPQSIRREREMFFDSPSGRVVTRRIVYYRDLPLQEDADAAVDTQAAGRILGEALRPRARELFDTEPAARAWLARLVILQKAMPEHPWPAMHTEDLGEILMDAAAGKRSVDEITQHGLTGLLAARLHYPLDRLFEQHAPEAIEVPTGNRIRLDYTAGAAPVLAVRLQELFGWTDTPRIAGGRVPVVLHLLGPNYRPVQITEDLRSFWGTTYFQVRKDLRARYPKHSWPEDPLTARPEAKGGRRRGSR